MYLHPEQTDEHPCTHSIMSYSLSYRCISQYQEMIEGRGQSFIGFNLPPQSSQPQFRACKVFLCHCWTWLKTARLWYFITAQFGGNMLGWSAPGSSDMAWCQGVILLSFQYDDHDLLISGNDLVFRWLHTSGHFSLFMECQGMCFSTLWLIKLTLVHLKTANLFGSVRK